MLCMQERCHLIVNGCTQVLATEAATTLFIETIKYRWIFTMRQLNASIFIAFCEQHLNEMFMACISENDEFKSEQRGIFLCMLHHIGFCELNAIETFIQIAQFSLWFCVSEREQRNGFDLWQFWTFPFGEQWCCIACRKYLHIVYVSYL